MMRKPSSKQLLFLSLGIVKKIVLLFLLFKN